MQLSPYDLARVTAIVETLNATGIRLSELLRLRIGDITTEDDLFQLKVRGRGGAGGILPLGQAVHAAISEWIRVRGQSASDLLWCGERGDRDPLTRDALRQLLRAYAGLTGRPVEELRPHQIRRSFGLRCSMGNYSMAQVRRYIENPEAD